MARKTVTILGISPGTRTIGIAVVRNGDLIEWKLKTFKGKWSKEKLESILEMIEKLWGHFRVTTVALKAVNPLRSSKRVDKLIASIIAQAQMNAIGTSLSTIQELKEFCGEKYKKSRDGLMEFITEKYPELKKVYLKERNNLNPYYVKMFEAIAVAKRDMAKNEL